MNRRRQSAVTKMQAIIVAVILIVVIVAGAAYYYFYVTGEPVKEEIVIGAAVAQTGPYATAGSKITWGYQYAIEKINEKFGGFRVDGRAIPVRLVLYDDKSDPTVTKSLYERLITVDQVDFLFGPYASSPTFAMMPVAEKYKMVAIHPASTNPKNWQQGYEYQFHNLPWLDDQAADPHFDLLEAIPAADRPKTAAVVNTADFYPRSRATYLKEAAPKYGIEVIFEDEVEKGATDVSAAITKAKDSNADVFIGVGYFTDESLMVRTMKELNYHPKMVITPTSNVPEYPEVLGETGNGIMASVNFHMKLPWTSEVVTMSEYVADHRAEFGADPWDGYKPEGIAVCTILRAAIEGANSLDHEDVREWLITPGNMVKTIMSDWEVDHDEAAKGRKWICKLWLAIAQWQPSPGATGGIEFEIIWPKDVATADIIYPRGEV